MQHFALLKSFLRDSEGVSTSRRGCCDIYLIKCGHKNSSLLSCDFLSQECFNVAKISRNLDICKKNR